MAELMIPWIDQWKQRNSQSEQLFSICPQLFGIVQKFISEIDKQLFVAPFRFEHRGLQVFGNIEADWQWALGDCLFNTIGQLLHIRKLAELNDDPNWSAQLKITKLIGAN